MMDKHEIDRFKMRYLHFKEEFDKAYNEADSIEEKLMLYASYAGRLEGLIEFYFYIV